MARILRKKIVAVKWATETQSHETCRKIAVRGSRRYVFQKPISPNSISYEKKRLDQRGIRAIRQRIANFLVLIQETLTKALRLGLDLAGFKFGRPAFGVRFWLPSPRTSISKGLK